MFARVICMVAMLVGNVAADEWDVKHLGFSGIPIQGNETLMKGLGFAKLPVKKGILVAVVNPDTPTAAGGLLPLAIVSAINRKPVGSQADAAEVLSSLELGADVLLAGHTLRNNVWKPGTVKTKVMTHRQVLESSMERAADAISGVERYSHKFEAKGEPKTVELYVLTLPGRGPQLRAEATWVDDDWLFLESLTLANEQARDSVKFTRGTGEDKAKGGLVLERKTAEVTAEFGALLVRSGTTVRMVGSKSIFDHSPSLAEVWSNRDVLDFYRMMSAKP
jgi:hypothetical protein